MNYTEEELGTLFAGLIMIAENNNDIQRISQQYGIKHIKHSDDLYKFIARFKEMGVVVNGEEKGID